MIAAVFIYGCASVPLDENCAFRGPPREAYQVDIGVGDFLFVYPKVPVDNYTGCWTFWNSVNTSKTIFYFKNGIPTKAELYLENKLVASCEIKEKNDVNDGQSRCSTRDEINSMIEAHKKIKPSEHAIPPDRDPRR
jgi:hypothetical protein